MSIDKEKKTELIEQYSRSKTDTGSPEVQIAILTQRIENLTEHGIKVSKPNYDLTKMMDRKNDIVKKIDKNLIQKVTIFDVYEGDKLPDNKKSIAFRILLQPQDKTFNDQEIENLSKQIIELISKTFDASIRK